MGNLAFRSQTSGNDSSFSASSINATLPAGTQAGDLQLIWISAGLIPPTAAPTIITPSGWTLAGSAAQTIASAGVNIRIHLFYKIAGPAEGTVNLAISGGANGAFGWGRLSYQNPDPVTQVPQVTFGQGTATTSAVVTGITTGAANAFLNTFLTQGVAQVATPPGSMTERIDNAAGGFEIAEELQAAAGASGNRTFTLPTSADYAWGFAELRSNNAVIKVYPLFSLAGAFGAGPFGEFMLPNVVAYAASATGSIATTGTATTKGVFSAAVAQAIATGGTATATGVFSVAATQAVTTGHGATAQLMLATTAASSITVGGTALSAAAVASAASSSISTTATAAALLVASAATTATITTGGTATNRIVAGGAAASSIATTGAATSQATVAAAAAAAIATGGAATALDIGAAAASSAIATTGTATTQSTVAAAAAAAVTLNATATSATAGGQDAASSVATGATATTQAVSSAAAAASIATAAAATAQQTDAAAASSAITVGGSATIAGGNVYDVSAAEAVHAGDAATGPGLLHVSATQAVDVGDAATAAVSGSTAELEAEILRLRTLLAMASGGADDSANAADTQQRDILRHRELIEAAAEGKRARIARQNDMIIKFATATVLHEEEPAS